MTQQAIHSSLIQHIQLLSQLGWAMFLINLLTTIVMSLAQAEHGLSQMILKSRPTGLLMPIQSTSLIIIQRILMVKATQR